ncbi:alcohol acetyltransferase [Halteromyces radiatus]|uniref:alcohol acetyltransferase n=1 Tax=Halteromyces radiatus TaxID=101107 RepID=UPI00221E95FD|nr:alcohol acetyltransferase [Halteromyces radiatus]KAI8077781.1 alcohol acetyltransferase [Halteromyces radiatus]
MTNYITQRPLGMFEKNQIAKQLTKGYASVTLTASLHHPPRSNGDIPTVFYKKYLYPALATMIQKHPMLRLTVHDTDKSSAHFVQLLKLAYDDLVLVTDHDQFWIPNIQETIITEECQHEFDLFGLCPLWRLRVSCHPDKLDQCSITLSVQHVIADGLSTTVLWQELLHNLNNIDSNSHNHIVDSLYFDTSSVCQVPLAIEDRNGPKDINVSPSDPVPTDGWQGDYAAPPNEKLDTVMHLMQVDVQTWTSLLKKAKMYEVSLHAVLYSAYLLSWMSEYPDQAVKTVTAINCRTYCQPPIPHDELGIFFGRFEYGWPLEKLNALTEDTTDDETPLDGNKHLFMNDNIDTGIFSTTTFWKLAKIYHDVVQENKLLTCQRSLLMGDSLPNYPEDYCNVWYNARKMFEKGRSGGLNISDLGKFNYSTGAKATWTLDHLWFSQSAHFYATILAVNAITVNGSMHATITWQRGSVQEEKALRFIELFHARLKKESLV